MKVLEVIAPTINYQCGDIANIPVIQDGDTDKICEVTQENISISKTDWDSYKAMQFCSKSTIRFFTVNCADIT